MKLYLSSYKIGDEGKKLAEMVGENKRIALISNALDCYSDLERRKKSDRIGDFSTPEDREIDEFCKIAYKVIGDMGFEAKRSIVRKVVDTIVGTQTDIKVYGHLPINASIIASLKKGGIQDVKFQTKRRNSRFTQCWEEYPF